MSEGTLTDDNTNDSHHHSTTIEISGNGQVNAAYEDTETNNRDSRTFDVANGNPVNQDEAPSTPLVGQRDVTNHMNGTATSEAKVNGVEPKSPTAANNDVKDVAEAVNLELVNMQPFNNGIPIKKESTELDIGDPYDEYFVPVNQHKKYMRGEKLYVTQDKRRNLGGGKRKCCWGLLSVIVLGILVAILIGVLLTQESNAPVESRTFNGDVKGAGLGSIVPTPPPKSTQQPPRPTTDVSEMYLQRVIEGELTIDNMEFTPGLADQKSSEFMTLATSLEEELKRALFDRQTLLYGSSDITVKVVEFRSGSVIVLYRVGWQFKPGVHNSPDPLTEESLKTRLQTHLRNNDGFLYNYRLPISSLKSNRIMDLCQLNNNNCSNNCHFNFTTLLFTCSCPMDYILDTDGKTCIENYVEQTDYNHDNFPEEPFPVPYPSPDYDNEHTSSSEPTFSSSSETMPLPDHHPSTERETETEMETEQPEPSTERHKPIIPHIEPELSQESESSTEHESDSSSSEQSVSSESSQEHTPSSEIYPPLEQDIVPEIKSSTETSDDTEPLANTNPPEYAANSNSDLLPAVETSTEHEMFSESDSSNMSSHESDNKPQHFTEYTSYESSEGPNPVSKEEQAPAEQMKEMQTSEEPKPLLELLASTEAQPINETKLDEATNHSDYKTEVISGQIPFEEHPAETTTMQQVSSTVEPKQDNETFTQTGSMRSLNLEHSTGYIGQLNEKESNSSTSDGAEIKSNSSTEREEPATIPSHSKEETSFTESEEGHKVMDAHVIAGIASIEELSGSTDVSPTNEQSQEEQKTMNAHVFAGIASNDELGSLDVNSTKEDSQEEPKTMNDHVLAGVGTNEESDSKDDSIVKEDSQDDHKAMHPNISAGIDTNEEPKSSDVITVEEDSQNGNVTNNNFEIISKTTFSPLNEKTPSADTTEKHPSIISSTEIMMEVGNTDSSVEDKAIVGKMKHNEEEMSKEIEFEISHAVNSEQDDNKNVTSVHTHAITTVRYRHDPMNDDTNGTVMSPVEVNMENVQAIPKLNVSTQSESTTPYLKMEAVNNENLNEITTHLPLHTTMLPKLESTNMQDNSSDVGTTFLPISLEHFTEKIENNGSTRLIEENQESVDKTTTSKPAEHESIITTIGNMKLLDIVKEGITGRSDLEPVPTTEKDKNVNNSETVTTEHRDLITTTEMNAQMSRETLKEVSNEESHVNTLNLDQKTESTTLKAEHLDKMTSTDSMKINDTAIEHTTMEIINLSHSSSEQPYHIPLHLLNGTSETDEMPLVSITHIPDLAGPYSVDSIVEHSTNYPFHNQDEGINNAANIEQDNHQPDITADTLNSLDDDYNEEDKKKYYKPAKTKNFKNFKIQEVNIPIDSLADETTKDVQHSKDIPQTSKINYVTTIKPTVNSEDLNSNDAFTTLAPLFKEVKSTKHIPNVVAQETDEHLNGLFFSNEAETTLSPIFDNNINSTGLNQNKTLESLSEHNNSEVGFDQLKSTSVSNNEELTTETMKEISSGDIPKNTTLDKPVEVTTKQPENIIHPEHNFTSGVITTLTPENLTETSSESYFDKESTSKQSINSSGLLELLNPSIKCATGQFACADGSGCIKTIQRCDNIRDCLDSSDELNCEEQGCLGNFQCKSRQCIKRSLVCDSIPHCPDSSDESDCENWKCQFDEVRCPNSGQCIPVLWKCDGKGDCRDSADEFGCRESCANDEFFCPEGRCIPHNSTCNAINDCLKGEDEMHCSST